jgi:hypothetical protein
MKNLALTILVSACTMQQATAQAVSKSVVVEQFTNTYCSICASRNPGFYSNLAQFPQVLHISYFPSSPYAACPLNRHNKTENDARTNFYGIYGSTPRLVLQGQPLPGSANYNDNSLFQNQLGQTTAFSIGNTVSLSSPHTISVRTVVKKVDASPLTTLQLYAAMVEDTLVFNANNGETHHYNVFRRAVWAAGFNITVPANVGDSVVYTETIPVNSEWNLQHMFAIALLQDANKEVVQAAKSNPLAETLGIDEMKPTETLALYPNPAIDRIRITLPQNTTQAEVNILDMSGARVHTYNHTGQNIELNILGYKPGIYYVYIVAGERCYVSKFVKS